MAFADVVAGINGHELALQLLERKRSATNAAKKQTRRSISVRGPAYWLAREATDGGAASLSSVTEALLALFLRGEIDIPALAGAIAHQPDAPGRHRATPEERRAYTEWLTGNG